MTGTMNGYQLVQEARRRRPGLKVLYTSAYSNTRLSHIAGSELQPLLRKPFEEGELAQMVQDALR